MLLNFSDFSKLVTNLANLCCAKFVSELLSQSISGRVHLFNAAKNHLTIAALQVSCRIATAVDG